MSKRFQSLVLITCSLVAVSVLASYVIDRVVEIDWLSLQTFTNIVASISSLITLSIAVVLYRRFSSNQLLVDKQTEKVVELLTFINSLRFYYKVIENGSDMAMYLNVQVTDHKLRRIELVSEDGNDYQKYTNYAGPQLLDAVFHMSEQSNDPYLPKVIADMIEKKLYIGSASSVEKSKLPKSYFLVGVHGDFKKTRVDDNDDSALKYEPFFNTINGTSFIYENWISELEIIYQECYSWIRSNNQTVFSSLNIKPVLESKQL